MPTASAPIRIGYCLSLPVPVADNSRSARLAHDIWQEDINRRGGLLGRSNSSAATITRTPRSFPASTNGGMELYPAENLLTRTEALRRYTVGSARFSDDAGKKGGQPDDTPPNHDEAHRDD